MGEIDRLSLIVDELLILSRAGEHELPGERLDLGATRRARAAERWQAAPRERGIELRGAAAASAAVAWCAGPDLDRSIDALVENALRYSPAGSAVDDRCGAGPDRGPRPRARASRPARRRRSSSASAAAAPGAAGPSGTGLGPADRPRADPQWGGEVRSRNRDGGGLGRLIDAGEEEVRR